MQLGIKQGLGVPHVGLYKKHGLWQGLVGHDIELYLQLGLGQAKESLPRCPRPETGLEPTLGACQVSLSEEQDLGRGMKQGMESGLECHHVGPDLKQGFEQDLVWDLEPCLIDHHVGL